ncbi:MAG TPA: stage II sporulation protein M [Steroidobacteraceae bacterium]|nr:stage II sporulation protein M [Steroidobacteraceae bacterium]
MTTAVGVRSIQSPPTLTVPSATGVDAAIVLAGPGARAMAFMVDWFLRTALSVFYMLLASLVLLGNLSFSAGPDESALWFLGGAVPAMAIYFLYHVILEPLMAGRTPGKRMAGLRVLTLEGQVPTTSALVIRNVFRLVDSMPVGYVVGLLFVLFGKRHLRLGDIAAGTVLAVERAPFLEKLAQERGEAQRHAAWHAVRQRAASLRRRADSSVDDALAVVDEYRRAAQIINGARVARRADDGESFEYLEAAYADLHDAIHRPARRGWQVLLALFRDRIPAAMQAIRVHLLAVTLLFITSGVVGAWLIFTYPDLIALFAGPDLIATVERGELWTEGMLNVAPSAVHSVDILTNNIVVAFFAFTLGLFFGIGTLYIIGMNGLSLGALFAFVGQHGLAGGLFDFVIAHGCVELSCICIAGAAGAYIGEALVRPGTRTRAEAFRESSKEALRVMGAVTVLLFICGFIEGYVSPDPEVPRWARVTVGVGFWLFMISFLRGYVFGRSRGGPPIAS